MPEYQAPPLLEPSLRSLQEYMHRFYPERAREDPIPLDFWSIADDELFLEVLSYMPLHLAEGALSCFEQLPIGFRIAYPIFWLEDDYQVNGWTALINAGEDLLQAGIRAYERVGMTSEANALSAALSSVRRHPGDEEAAESAYKSVPNRYSDEAVKFAELLRFFRSNSQLWLVQSEA